MPPEMKNAEAIQMMNRCKQEILSLRAVIARLEPKADAYDNLVRVLRIGAEPVWPRSPTERLNDLGRDIDAFLARMEKGKGNG